MLFANGRHERGGEQLSFFEVAEHKLSKYDRSRPHSNGSAGVDTGGDLTPNHRHSGDFYLDQDSDSPTFQNGRSSKSSAGMERDLRSSIAKLYQNYDFVTDEYDRLYEIVDHLREDYNNSKNLLFYNRYKEFRRIIKNSLRQWRSVEKRSTLAMSRKTSNTNYSMAMSGSLSRTAVPPGVSSKISTSLGSIDEGGTFSQNLDARLKAQHNVATRDLYAECTRLEREIFQYKSRNQMIKNLICKLAEAYENSKAHVLHIWGRFKELRAMIKDVIDSDV